MEPMTTFLRQKRLRWYRNVPTTNEVLNMQMKGKRRESPKQRWLDNIREDMEQYKMATIEVCGP